MSQVIAKLLEDHRRMTVLLGVLDREVDNFAEGESLNFFLIETILDYMTNYPEKCHHPIENVILKNLTARNRPMGEKAAKIITQHETVNKLITEFANAFERVQLEETQLREDLITAARNYRDYLLHHMKEEEEIFFPAAEEALYQSDWDIIETRLRDKGDPVFGRDADREYRALHKVIVEWGER